MVHKYHGARSAGVTGWFQGCGEGGSAAGRPLATQQCRHATEMHSFSSRMIVSRPVRDTGITARQVFCGTRSFSMLHVLLHLPFTVLMLTVGWTARQEACLLGLDGEVEGGVGIDLGPRVVRAALALAEEDLERVVASRVVGGQVIARLREQTISCDSKNDARWSQTSRPVVSMDTVTLYVPGCIPTFNSPCEQD